MTIITPKDTADRGKVKSSAFPPFDHSLSEDEQVVQQFVQIVQSKLDSQDLHHSRLHKKEKKLLKDCVYQPGAYVGAIVGLVSFVTLRKAPVKMMHHLQLKHFRKNAAANNTKNHGSSSTNKDPHITPPLFQEGPLLVMIGGTVDFIVASMMGTVAWMTCINKKHTLQACATLPLLSGTSHISKTLCPEFVPLYKSIDSDFWKTYTDDAVQAIRQFSKNCETRRLYEESLMMEMGFNRRDINMGKVHVDIREDIDPHWNNDDEKDFARHDDDEHDHHVGVGFGDDLVVLSTKKKSTPLNTTATTTRRSSSSSRFSTRHSRHGKQEEDEDEDEWNE